jgi:hypothetical protein
MLLSGVGAICLWLADGFTDSLLKTGRFVRWWCTGAIPGCAACGGTGRQVNRSTLGLVVDYSLLLGLGSLGLWFWQEALDRVIGS